MNEKGRLVDAFDRPDESGEPELLHELTREESRAVEGGAGTTRFPYLGVGQQTGLAAEQCVCTGCCLWEPKIA